MLGKILRCLVILVFVLKVMIVLSTESLGSLDLSESMFLGKSQKQH